METTECQQALSHDALVLLTQLFCCFQPRGDPTDVGFSEVEEKLGYGIFAFIPQISLPQFEYPLLLCDVSKIDQNRIGWEDTVNGMDAHNLIYDIPGLADTKDEGEPDYKRRKGGFICEGTGSFQCGEI